MCFISALTRQFFAFWGIQRRSPPRKYTSWIWRFRHSLPRWRKSLQIWHLPPWSGPSASSSSSTLRGSSSGTSRSSSETYPCGHTPLPSWSFPSCDSSCGTYSWRSASCRCEGTWRSLFSFVGRAPSLRRKTAPRQSRTCFFFKGPWSRNHYCRS